MERVRELSRLADGREVLIRQPDPERDVEALVEFLSALPEDVRIYLRYNVTETEIARARLAQIDNGDHWRVIAELDGGIVGDATMDREPFGWSRHVAELRGVVHPEYRHMGIEPMLLGVLSRLAAGAGVERVFTEVLAGQREMIDVLQAEGFEYEFTRRKYAKDQRGKLHDVIVMSNDLESLWKQLAEQLEEMDIRLSRFYGRPWERVKQR